MLQNVSSTLVPFGEATGQHSAYDIASLTSALPFNEVTVPNGYNDGMPPSSSEMNPIDANLMAQQLQPGYLQVRQPEQRVNMYAPVVIRGTVGTPAIVASADRRRKHPRKHACHICGSMFTSAANRDRELLFAVLFTASLLTHHSLGHVRAHYGIKPCVCLCGMAFTAKADLSRHRKSSRCLFPIE